MQFHTNLLNIKELILPLFDFEFEGYINSILIRINIINIVQKSF